MSIELEAVFPGCFADVAEMPEPLEDGLAMEAKLIKLAATGRSFARLWRSKPMIVVPRSYRNYGEFEAVQRRWEGSDMPIRVRQSGGGAVPQGDGILNVTLVWRTEVPALAGADDIYRSLCAIVSLPAQQLGIECQTEPVPESFCDGRFNVSIRGRKVAGTAQHWHHSQDGYIVLAHAMLVVDSDPEILTALANTLEMDLGSGRTYCPKALTSIDRELAVAGLMKERKELFTNVASTVRDSLESGCWTANAPARH